MNQMNVRSAFDYGRSHTQTSQARLVQQQCYCKDIQLMKTSESPLGVTIVRSVFEFSVPKVCSVCLIQATHACHSEVLTRFFGLWSPKKRFGLWHFSARRPQPRSNEEFQPFSCPTRSLRSLTAAADSTSSALWLHNACKRQKIELWYARLGLQDIDCDLGCLIYETAASQ